MSDFIRINLYETLKPEIKRVKKILLGTNLSDEDREQYKEYLNVLKKMERQILEDKFNV